MKYYINTFTIKILSEDKPLYDLDLEDMYFEVMERQSVLHSIKCEADEVNGKEMARQLYDAGSEPSFFSLNENGKYVEQD